MSRKLNTVYYYNRSCNLRCRHCWISPKETTDPKEELTFDEVTRMFLDLKASGVNSVKFGGGEPLALPYAEDLIDFFAKEKIDLFLETNGTLMTPRLADLVKEAGGSASVSLDGPDEETHGLLRISKDSFEQAKRGIRLLVERGVNTQVIFSVHKGNIGSFMETVSLAKSLGASFIKVNFINSIGHAETMVKNGLLLDVSEFIDFFKRTDSDELTDFVFFNIPIAFKKIRRVSKEMDYKCNICGVVGVLSNGDVSICGVGNLKDDLILGNIRSNSLLEIWQNHPLFQQLHRDIPANLGGICSKCMFKRQCLGSCVVNTYNATGSFNAGYPFCEEADRLELFPRHRLVEV
ncbi:MAG: radical SAM protein [Desulfuromonadaceae bacterium]